MKTLLAIALAAVTAAAGAATPPGNAAPPAPPPKLDLVLRPHATGGAGSFLAVRMTLEAPHLSAGDPLVHIPLKIVGIPTARYDGDALAAADAHGPLALTQEEEPPTPQGVYRRWKLTRATVGDVVLDYRAPPRVVTAATNNGPLFDLREEAGGFAGAGIGFLALPVDKVPHHVRLRWDLSDAPAGSRGEWSLADGDTELDIPAETLAFSYYAVGPLKSIPAQNDGKFGLYWLGEPNFDMSLLGERIRSLYATMSAFFGGTHSSYRVFVRQNPYEGHGGSALAKSFMFGYNPQEPQTVDKLQDLLAHEMTHNWPALEGEHGDTAWYTEGTAEYYSLLLSHRGGQLTTAHFLDSINERAAGYYSNPYLHLTNPEAARIFWTDPIAQTVPYGRGFLYLIIIDAAIRAHSRGRRSLDDVVLELQRREQRGAPYGIPQWLELVGRELGRREAQRGYDAMVSGSLERLPESRFAPCLRVVAHPTRTFQLGFARASLNDDRIVRELDPHSVAAAAGVRNGDAIVDVKGMLEARKDEATPITLSVRRDGASIAITYLPRGAPTEGYAWVRNAAAPDSSCKF